MAALFFLLGEGEKKLGNFGVCPLPSYVSVPSSRRRPPPPSLTPLFSGEAALI